MRDAGQIPLPDEDAELSDTSYDNEIIHITETKKDFRKKYFLIYI